MGSRTRLAIVILAAGVALAVPDRYSLTVFHEANTAGRVYAIQSFVHFGSWSFEDILCRSGKGHSLVDLSVKDGRPLLQKAPGPSWLGLGPYWLVSQAMGGDKLPFHWTCTLLGLICIWLPGLFLLFVLGRWLADGDTDLWAGVAVILLLMAAPFWTALPMFLDYALASLLLPAAWIAWQKKRKATWVLGGLLAGIAVTFNYMFAVYAAAAGAVELARRWRGREQPVQFLLWTAAGAAGPVAALLAYHAVVWGHPFATAYDFVAYQIHHRMVGSTGMSLSAFWNSFFHPKLGLLFTTPWVLPGLAGLVWMAAKGPGRATAATGLLVTAATLLFVAWWRGSNTDDLAFNRHAMPVYPWAAIGIAGLGRHWLPRLKPMAQGLLAWGLVGLAAVSFLYQFVTAWTYPYHHDGVPSPLWQVSIPLFINGLHLPVVSLSPDPARTTAALEGGQWAWVLATFLLACAAALLALRPLFRSLPAVKYPAARPACAVGLASAMLFWGVRSDRVDEDLEREAKQIAARAVAGEQVSPEERETVKLVRSVHIFYEVALSDVLGSYFTPQDAGWNEAGHPGRNRWCGPPPPAP